MYGRPNNTRQASESEHDESGAGSALVSRQFFEPSLQVFTSSVFAPNAAKDNQTDLHNVSFHRWHEQEQTWDPRQVGMVVPVEGLKQVLLQLGTSHPQAGCCNSSGAS